MGKMHFDTYIEAPPERVFALASDFPAAPAHIAGIDSIEMLTDGPVGIGTRFRESRTMFGRTATEEMEVAAFDPGRGYTLACESCGSRFESDVRVAPEGPGTRYTLDMSWKPLTLGARLMAPMGVLMKGAMRRCIGQDLADLKAAAEGRGGPHTDGAAPRGDRTT